MWQKKKKLLHPHRLPWKHPLLPPPWLMQLLQLPRLLPWLPTPLLLLPAPLPKPPTRLLTLLLRLPRLPLPSNQLFAASNSHLRVAFFNGVFLLNPSAPMQQRSRADAIFAKA
jgi:hypothetical protein